MKRVNFSDIVIKTILIVIVAICTTTTVIGQENKEFKVENFKSKEDYQDALGNRKLGDENYDNGKGYYHKAIEYYLLAYRLIPDNAELNYKLGVCILYGMPAKVEAIEYLENAFRLDNNVINDIHFTLARAYHINGQYDRAIEEYDLHYNSLSPEEQLKSDKIEQYKGECLTAKKLVKNPINVEIENLGTEINSWWMDHSPLVSADESIMIFTSQRENSTGGKTFNAGKYYEDIYFSKNVDGKWQKAENIGQPVNTEDHDATVGLSADGQKLFIYVGSKGNGDIFSCDLVGEQWTAPVPLPKTINTQFQETSACLSHDGNVIYFVSNRPDGNLGGKDIYMSTKDENGNWGEAVNLGSVINTPDDEEGVFMHVDGKTLYFSSQGHSTMGGFDIFKSVKDASGKWSTPGNLGYPVNTPGNDMFFSMCSDGDHGYFSTVNDEGFGSQDIYSVHFLTDNDGKSDKDGPKVTIVCGTVIDPATGNPIEATIEIVDNELNKVVSKMKSNSTTGKYLVSLPSGKDYGLTVDAEGYLFHSENFNIPDSAFFRQIVLDVKVSKIEEGANIVLNNIFFEYFSSKLNKKSSTELKRLMEILNSNPEMKIEISGHSDNVGPEDGNVRLSQARAKAVAKFLTDNKIDSSRLVHKGYGSSIPIADNSTVEGQAKNRRVEIKILSK